MKLKRLLVSVLILLLVFFGSNKVLDYLQDRKNIENYGVEAAEKNKNQLVKNELLILLVGVDKNPDSEALDFTRTDTIMLCKVNTETGKIDIMSIPRDSRIKVRNDFTKANHAHAYGGIELTLQSLRDFLGIDIDYYAEIDYDAVVKIVDALGGVDYTVPEGINVKRGSYIDIKPGKNHLSGEEVLWYLRTRNIYENGDLGRVGTQQKFIKAMVDEIVKKSSKTNLVSFVETYLQYVKTNVPMSIIMDILTNINSLSSKNVKTHIVPGVAQMIGDTSYYIPNYEKTWDIIDRVFSDYKLKNWTKEDSGYEEYYGYDYENQYDENSLDSINQPIEENYEESNYPAVDNNYYQELPPTNNQNVEAPAQTYTEYEVHTYYEYTYPDGRVEIHDQPPEGYYEEENTQEETEAD